MQLRGHLGAPWQHHHWRIRREVLDHPLRECIARRAGPGLGHHLAEGSGVAHPASQQSAAGRLHVADRADDQADRDRRQLRRREVAWRQCHALEQRVAHVGKVPLVGGVHALRPGEPAPTFHELPRGVATALPGQLLVFGQQLIRTPGEQGHRPPGLRQHRVVCRDVAADDLVHQCGVPVQGGGPQQSQVVGAETEPELAEAQRCQGAEVREVEAVLLERSDLGLPHGLVPDLAEGETPVPFQQCVRSPALTLMCAAGRNAVHGEHEAVAADGRVRRAFEVMRVPQDLEDQVAIGDQPGRPCAGLRRGIVGRCRVVVGMVRTLERPELVPVLVQAALERRTQVVVVKKVAQHVGEIALLLEQLRLVINKQCVLLVLCL